MPGNPLLECRPPQTTPIDYLILIEQHLTKDQLPTFHQILQDTTLTNEIGWDLVKVLLPLLPESEQCLQDVARLGNPREVIVNVTEMMNVVTSIEGEAYDDEDDDEEKGQKTGQTKKNALMAETRFVALVNMLSVLHERLQTKQPSRFLASSINVTLPAYKACRCVSPYSDCFKFYRKISALSNSL